MDNNIEMCLEKGVNSNPMIFQACLIGTDGEVISTHTKLAQPTKKQKELVGAIITTVASVSTKAGENLRTGEIIKILVEGKEKNIMILYVKQGYLMVVAEKNLNLGMLYVLSKKIVTELSVL